MEQSTKEGQTAASVAEYLAASWPPRRLLRAWARAASAASRERGCLAASLSARASLRLAYSAWAAWSSQVARGRLLDQYVPISILPRTRPREFRHFAWHRTIWRAVTSRLTPIVVALTCTTRFTRRHCLRSLALVWRAWKDAVHATLSKEFDVSAEAGHPEP